MWEWGLIPCYLSFKHERRWNLFSFYLFICLLEREAVFSLQLCLLKHPSLLVLDSITSRCYDVVSVHLSVKKSACDHILWIVSLHLCGDGLLIATLSLTLFLSPTGKSDKRLENMSLLSFVMVEFWILHQQLRWLFHFIFKNVKVNDRCHWNERNQRWPMSSFC